MNKRKTKYDWNIIQGDYNLGLTYRDLQKKYGMSSCAIAKAHKRGVLITRTQSEAMKLSNIKYPRKLSEETKKKISNSMKKFFNKNPDRIPYLLNHSSKISYPEQCFINYLKLNSIEGWEYNYPIGRYLLDFGFPQLKIDVEIDGGTHLQEKVILKDIERDSFLKSKGWKVVRFTANEAKGNTQECIEYLQGII